MNSTTALDLNPVSLGMSFTQIAVQFSPLPGLSPAVDILFGIIRTCQSIKSNRYAAQQLQERCHQLLLAIAESNFVPNSENMGRATMALVELLSSIHRRMEMWAGKKGVSAFFAQKDIEGEILQSQKEISICFEQLQLTSHFEILNWQTAFSENQKLDHKELVQSLSEIKDSQEILQQILVAQDEKISWIMSVMQKSIPKYEAGDSTRDGLQTNLYSIQKHTGAILPEPNLKRGEVRKTNQEPIKRLLVYDLYEGLYLGQQRVWLKQLRSINASPKAIARFRREAKIWGNLWARDQYEWNNYNTPRRILPFLGFSEDHAGHQCFVSAWQGNGTAMEYLLEHPGFDRLKLIRGIAQGLLLLHTMEPPVVHGELNAAAVFIDDWGNPLLADFGIAKVVEDVVGSAILTQSQGIHESVRWFAPEVNEERVLSTHSDIYAFAMTIIEIMTGQRPWDAVKNSFQVVSKVSKKIRPERPPEIANDQLWNLIQSCWAQEPQDRPRIQEVVVALQNM